MEDPNIPPDVAAYITASALDLVEENSSKFESEEEFQEWFLRNFADILKRAHAKWSNMVNLVLNNSHVLGELTDHMAPAVYDAINASRSSDCLWNPKYVEYAALFGDTPEERKEKDGGHFGAFMRWVTHTKNIDQNHGLNWNNQSRSRRDKPHF